MPKNDSIEEAKRYIKERLEAELSMENNLNKFMNEAASRIVDAAYRHKIPPRDFRFSRDKKLEAEVDAIIRELKSRIEDAMITLATSASESDKDGIVAFVTKENHGKTFAERSNIYCQRFKYELEGAIAAGLLLDVSKEKLKNSISLNLKHPYANPYFKEALKDKSAATRLTSNGISYGRGKTNSMFTALSRLTRHGVSQGWMKHWGDAHAGASGFYSYRGSSYPCHVCDAMLGFHPMEEYQGGWHLRCKCYFVFI